MFVILALVALVAAAATDFCPTGTIGATVVAPAASGEYVATGCTATGTLRMSGENAPALMLPDHGAVVLRFTTGTIAANQLVHIVGLLSAAAADATTVPIHIAVTYSTLMLNAVLRIDGVYPPHSTVNITGNTATVNATNTAAFPDVYTYFTIFMLIGNATTIQMHPGSAILVTDNRFNMITPPSQFGILILVHAMTMDRDTTVAITRNHFLIDGIVGSRNHWGVFFIDAVSQLAGATSKGDVTVIGDGAAFLIDDNTFNVTQRTNIFAANAVTINSPNLFLATAAKGLFSFRRNVADLWSASGSYLMSLRWVDIGGSSSSSGGGGSSSAFIVADNVIRHSGAMLRFAGSVILRGGGGGGAAGVPGLLIFENNTLMGPAPRGGYAHVLLANVTMVSGAGAYGAAWRIIGNHFNTSNGTNTESPIRVAALSLGPQSALHLVTNTVTAAVAPATMVPLLKADVFALPGGAGSAKIQTCDNRLYNTTYRGLDPAVMNPTYTSVLLPMVCTQSISESTSSRPTHTTATAGTETEALSAAVSASATTTSELHYTETVRWSVSPSLQPMTTKTTASESSSTTTRASATQSGRPSASALRSWTRSTPAAAQLLPTTNSPPLPITPATTGSQCAAADPLVISAHRYAQQLLDEARQEGRGSASGMSIDFSVPVPMTVVSSTVLTTWSPENGPATGTLSPPPPLGVLSCTVEQTTIRCRLPAAQAAAIARAVEMGGGSSSGSGGLALRYATDVSPLVGPGCPNRTLVLRLLVTGAAIGAGELSTAVVVLTAGSAAASLLTVAFDPAAWEGAAAVFLLLGPCADLRFAGAAAVAQYLVAPAIALGGAAVALIHAGAMGALVAAHALLALRGGAPRAWFPSVSLAAAAVLYPGLVLGTAIALRHIATGNANHNTTDTAAVAVGGPVLVAVPCVVFAVLRTLLKADREVPAPPPPPPRAANAHNTFNTRQHHQNPVLVMLRTRWTSPAVARRAGLLRGLYHHAAAPVQHVLQPLLLLAIAAVVLVPPAASSSSCTARYAIVAALVCLHASVMLLVLRPYRAPLLAGLSAVVQLVLGTTAAILAVISITTALLLEGWLVALAVLTWTRLLISAVLLFTDMRHAIAAPADSVETTAMESGSFGEGSDSGARLLRGDGRDGPLEELQTL